MPRRSPSIPTTPNSQQAHSLTQITPAGAFFFPPPSPFPCRRRQAARKDEEIEALRAQLGKSAGAMEEVSSLRADLEDLRRAAEGERRSAERAADEARQEAEAVKQLR